MSGQPFLCIVDQTSTFRKDPRAMSRMLPSLGDTLPPGALAAGSSRPRVPAQPLWPRDEGHPCRAERPEGSAWAPRAARREPTAQALPGTPAEQDSVGEKVRQHLRQLGSTGAPRPLTFCTGGLGVHPQGCGQP